MTKHEILVNKFNLFCKVYGLRNDPDVVTENVKGICYKSKWITLDKYNGYRLEIINPDTSESYFDGKAGRKTANEMINYLDGLIAAANPDTFKGIKIEP